MVQLFELLTQSRVKCLIIFLHFLTLIGCTKGDKSFSPNNTNIGILDSLINQSEKLSNKGEIDSAYAILDTIYNLASATDSLSYMNYADFTRGRLYFLQNELDTALFYWLNALKISHKLESEPNAAELLSNIGIIYFDKGYLRTAIEYFVQARKKMELNGDTTQENFQYTSRNRNQNSNKDVFVGIIQLNNKPYQLGKFLVKDSNGVILDSLFTDENGIFIYHKLKSTIATIEPVNVSPNNSFVFYNVDNATQLLSQVQAKIKNNKDFNELLLDNHLVKARLESKDGMINLANFKVPLTSELSINSPITEEVLNYKRLSKSFMNNLIQNYEINPIQFRFDSYQIQRKYYDELNELVAFVANYDQFELQIIGHTDISGHPTYNLLLSENRAKSIQRYFLRKGISNVGFMIQGVGSDKPITSNDTREGRKLNRRVEIQLKVKE